MRWLLAGGGLSSLLVLTEIPTLTHHVPLYPTTKHNQPPASSHRAQSHSATESGKGLTHELTLVHHRRDDILWAPDARPPVVPIELPGCSWRRRWSRGRRRSRSDGGGFGLGRHRTRRREECSIGASGSGCRDDSPSLTSSVSAALLTSNGRLSSVRFCGSRTEQLILFGGSHLSLHSNTFERKGY